MIRIVIIVIVMLTLVVYLLRTPCEQASDEIFGVTAMKCLMSVDMVAERKEICSLLEREANCDLHPSEMKLAHSIIIKNVKICIKEALKEKNYCFDEERLDGYL